MRIYVLGDRFIHGKKVRPSLYLKAKRLTFLFYSTRTYAIHTFLSFPRRRESSIEPLNEALDSRSPPSRGQASRE